VDVPKYSVDYVDALDESKGVLVRISSDALFQRFGDWQRQTGNNNSKMNQRLLTSLLKANRELEGGDGQPIHYTKLRFGDATVNGFEIRIKALQAWLRNKRLVVDSVDEIDMGDVIFE